MARKVTIQSMTRDLRGLIRDTEQVIRDVQWWNQHRAEEGPLDCERERVFLSKARGALAAINRGDMAEHSRLVSEMTAYAEVHFIDRTEES